MPTLRLLIAIFPVAGILAGCDSTGPSHRGTIATLFASSIFVDAQTGAQSGCALSGAWPLPEWPAHARTNVVSFHLSRQFTPTAGDTVLRDTLLSSTEVTLTRIDSLQVRIQLGPPLNQILVAVLDTVTDRTLGGVWSCPPTLPLGTDSLLKALGYAADSLPPGFLLVNRVIPVD